MTYRTPEELEAYNEGYRTAAVFIGRETTKGAEPEPKPKTRTWSDWWLEQFMVHMDTFVRVLGKGALRPMRERIEVLEKQNKALETRIDELETLLLLERKP